MHVDLASDLSNIFGTWHAGQADESSCSSLQQIVGLDTWATELNMGAKDGVTDFTTGEGSSSTKYKYRSTTDIHDMFRGTHSLTLLDAVDSWDVTTVKYMQGLFRDSRALRDVGWLGSWNTSNVERMDYMFAGMTALKRLNSVVNIWDTSKVQNFQHMFDGCTSVTEVDLTSTNWNMAAAYTGAAGQPYNNKDMLANLDNLQKIHLPNSFILTGTGLDNNTGRDATDGSWSQLPILLANYYYPWFGSSAALVRRYDGSGSVATTSDKVMGATNAYGTTDITYIWDADALGGRFESNPYAWWKFDRKDTLTIGLDGKDENNNPITLRDITEGTNRGGAGLIPIPWLQTVVVKDVADEWKPYATDNGDGTWTVKIVPEALVVHALVQADNGLKIDNPAGWFENYINLVDFDTAEIDMSGATNLSYMFYNTPRLEEVNAIDYWDVDQVTDFSHMFQKSMSMPTALIDDIGRWTIGTAAGQKITMESMFEDCLNLIDLKWLGTKNDLLDPTKKDWDTSHVVNFKRMFAGTNPVGAAKGDRGSKRDLFYDSTTGELDIDANFAKGCMQLKDITGIANWNTSAGLDFSGMFANCVNLKYVDISKWDTRAGSGSDTRASVDVKDMFTNVGSIEEITLSGDNVLEGTGFGETMIDGSEYSTGTGNPGDPVVWHNNVTRDYLDGFWEGNDTTFTPSPLDPYSGLNIWSGRTNALATLYGAAQHWAPAKSVKYTWDGSRLGGAFNSSRDAGYAGTTPSGASTTYYHYYAWWRYEKDAPERHLLSPQPRVRASRPQLAARGPRHGLVA